MARQSNAVAPDVERDDLIRDFEPEWNGRRKRSSRETV